MAWSDVEAKIKFDGFAREEEEDILEALADLYRESPTAQAVLDTGTGDITLSKGTSGSYAKEFSRRATIDLVELSQLRWMGRDGKLYAEKLGGTVIHELIHAILGYVDVQFPGTTDPTKNPLYNAARDYNDPSRCFPPVSLQNTAAAWS